MVRIKCERQPSSAPQVKSHIQFVFKLDIKEENGNENRTLETASLDLL